MSMNRSIVATNTLLCLDLFTLELEIPRFFFQIHYCDSVSRLVLGGFSSFIFFFYAEYLNKCDCILGNNKKDVSPIVDGMSAATMANGNQKMYYVPLQSDRDSSCFIHVKTTQHCKLLVSAIIANDFFSVHFTHDTNRDDVCVCVPGALFRHFEFEIIFM